MTTAVTARAGASAGAAVRSPSSWARFLVGFVALWGLLTATSGADPDGHRRVPNLLIVLLGALLVERALHGVGVRDALGRLGLGRPRWRALAVAVAASALVLAVYPLTAAVTGSALRLRPDWLWLSVGVLAFHGVAEELVWRGYAFRRLRVGRRFWPAVAWTMPLIAVTHVPIVLTVDPVVGVGAMLVAAVTSLPFSHLYEMGGRTIWAPAVLHAAIDSFKVFVVPATAVTTFSLLLVAVSLLVPLLVLVVPRAPADR